MRRPGTNGFGDILDAGRVQFYDSVFRVYSLHEVV